MKFCYNTNFTLPKQSQRSRSILQDRGGGGKGGAHAISLFDFLKTWQV